MSVHWHGSQCKGSLRNDTCPDLGKVTMAMICHQRPNEKHFASLSACAQPLHCVMCLNIETSPGIMPGREALMSLFIEVQTKMDAHLLRAGRENRILERPRWPWAGGLGTTHTKKKKKRCERKEEAICGLNTPRSHDCSHLDVSYRGDKGDISDTFRHEHCSLCANSRYDVQLNMQSLLQSLGKGLGGLTS